MFELKSLDKKILNLIQEEDLCVPRITKIAHKLKVPTSTVQARLNKLKEEKVIVGCTVLLNPKKVNKGFTAFMFAQAKMGEKADFKKYIQPILKIEQVQEVYYITGDYDYLIKIQVKDQHEYFDVASKIAKHLEARGKGIIAPKYFKNSPKLKVK
tara:strand:- start:866 stop:1330 length:465 start_codon:yes stop_codon:yes gene_type:complete